MQKQRIVIGITGASGAIFGVDFIQRLDAEKYLILSKWGRYVLKDETGLTEEDLQSHVKRVFPDEDLSSPVSSGSNRFDTMVILPCSVSTMAKIAGGLSDTLLTRTAQVALKERRRLIIGLRETPLSTIALEQAHRLSQAGAIIMPISPPFYHKPRDLQAMVEQFSDKVFSLLGQEPVHVWRGSEM